MILNNLKLSPMIFSNIMFNYLKQDLAWFLTVVRLPQHKGKTSQMIKMSNKK